MPSWRDTIEADIRPFSVVKSTWLGKLHHSPVRTTRLPIPLLSARTPNIPLQARSISVARCAVPIRAVLTWYSNRCHISGITLLLKTTQISLTTNRSVSRFRFIRKRLIARAEPGNSISRWVGRRKVITHDLAHSLSEAYDL